MIRLSLPFPNSVNNLYVNGTGKRGRYKSAAYKAWQEAAGLSVKDSHRQNIRVYSLAICLKRPDKRRRDLGNYEKAISDLLVAHGVIADDSGCERLTMQWDHGMREECVVLVMPAEEALAA
jgi:crossover junction endodeoxyribonuclease RusA